MAASVDMSTAFSRVAGGLVNAILGALILWVGQTTFRHAGILAGVDEKFNNVKHQFEDVAQSQAAMRLWLEKVVSEVKDSRGSQFTLKDGEKLATQIRQAEQTAADLERKLVERINALDLRLATLATQHNGAQEVAALKTEITQLRSDLTRASVAQEVQYQQQLQPSERFARGTPVFLPPVDTRR